VDFISKLINKGYLLAAGSMYHKHPWNIFIAQKVLYKGKEFFRLLN